MTMKLSKLFRGIRLRLPKSAEICVYDRVGAEVLIKELSRRGFNFEVLEVRGETLSLIPLLMALVRKVFKGGNAFDMYVDSYLGFVRCRTVITTTDNDTRFWRIGARNHHLKTIAIQNGIRGERFDVFEFDPVENCRTDYLFCFSKAIGERFQVHGTFLKVIDHGSMNSNHFSILRPKKKLGVAWISQFSPDWDNPSVSSEEFHRSEERAFRVFSEWAAEEGHSLSVLLRSEGQMARDEEHWFRKTNVRGEILFPFRDPVLGNYGLVDGLELLATCDSTLGYEALSRGAKVVFFAWRPKELGTLGFGWPSSLGDDGPFWDSSMNRDRVIKLLNETYEMSPLSFASEFEPFITKVMRRDQGNSQLFELLKSLGESKSF